MSSKNLAISVRGLSKEYRIRHQQDRVTTLGEAVARRIRKPVERTAFETFRALNDVSFDVEPGEVLGIIGRNGAGKSTLLKVLSRITEPTSGEVRMFGRVGSLLEVGTGFHPELTGRENIYLNGAILGMRRREIDRQFDAIVDFAEVERFLDTPVKRYSSGMYVRLAFSVAAHLSLEILVVDEVLAVGDVQFQNKCLGRIQSMSQDAGRTVLFVSHNMATVAALCGRAALLDAGRVKFLGLGSEAVAEYARDEQGAATLVPLGEPRTGFDAKLVAFALGQPDGITPPMVGRPLLASFTIEATKPAATYTIEYLVTTRAGDRILLVNSQLQGVQLTLVHGRNTIRCLTPICHLVPAEYDVEVRLMAGTFGAGFEEIQSARIPGGLHVHAGAFYPSGIQPGAKWAGIVQFETEWTVEPGGGGS